jgi:hypothetical protein
MKFSAPSGNASDKAPGTTASIPIRRVQLMRNRVPARAIRARSTAYTVAGAIADTDYGRPRCWIGWFHERGSDDHPEIAHQGLAMYQGKLS